MPDPSRPDLDRFPELKPAWDRREFVKSAAIGTAILALGGALVKLAAEDLTRPARACLVRSSPAIRSSVPPAAMNTVPIAADLSSCRRSQACLSSG